MSGGMIRLGTLEDRFWSRVEKAVDGCWQWKGAPSAAGYGTIDSGGDPSRRKRLYAHRVSYQMRHGEIPDGYQIDHLCRNRICVNPDHLEAVAPGVNTRRGLLGFDLTGLCRSGLHDVTDRANVYIRPNGDRRCRPCHGSKAVS